MIYKHKTKGVCSGYITVDIDENNGVLNNVTFSGGCNGNTNGIAALTIGQDAVALIDKLKDIKCGSRASSCPAELAKAISLAVRSSGENSGENIPD